MQEINCEYDALFKIWKDKAIKDNTLKEEEKEETAAGTRKNSIQLTDGKEAVMIRTLV